MPEPSKSARRPSPRKSKKEAPGPNVISSDRFRTPGFYRNLEMSWHQFAESDLSGSDFFGTKLANANFRGSRLVGVNFTQANLRGANFSGADLTDALLIDAFVQGARFAGAVGLTDTQISRLEKDGAVVREAAAPPRKTLAS